MPKPPNGSHAYTNGGQSRLKDFLLQTQKSASSTDNITDWGLNFEGRFNSSPHDVSEFFIPSFAGLGSAAGHIQRRFLRAYGSAIMIGVALFYGTSSPLLRVLGLNLIFPGAGFLALGGIKAAMGFVVSVILLLVCMALWLLAGVLASFIVHLVLCTYTATFLINSGDGEVFAYAVPVALGIDIVIYSYFTISSTARFKKEEKIRENRNSFLAKAGDSWTEESRAGSAPGSRELSLEQLRWIQWMIELGSQDLNDWSNFTVIDQFQVAALRYQLYAIVYCLSTYHTFYVPNCNGASSFAMRNAIEKAQSKKVLGFWKWESMWGNFSMDWDPIIKDDIMVTGYFLLALMAYTKSTGDDRYTKKGSLKMQVTENAVYQHDIHSCYEALITNWNKSELTLFPCEPHWVYGVCNAAGIAGATAYDRTFGASGSARIMKSFCRQFEEDFSTPSGSSIPIRSALTGFDIPGASGILSDTVGSWFCAPSMPVMARRLWFVSQHESVTWTEDGKIELENLKDTDLVDSGNYQKNLRAPYVAFGVAGTEWGNKKVADACIERVDEEFAPVLTTKSGSRRNTGLSVFMQGLLNLARISQGGDWRYVVSHEPSKEALAGPRLNSAPFPDVLVAKAFSKDSNNLELVLYPGRETGSFELELCNLTPEASYKAQGAGDFSADGEGKARINVLVDGRTVVLIEPMK